MGLDRTIRSALAEFFGPIGALASASFGEWGFAGLFLLISAAGWGFLIYLIRTAP